MRWEDFVRLAIGAVVANRMRSFLTALGITVGIAAVVLLTSIGSGIQRFVLAEFTQFGTNLIAITPGRTTTHGMSGAVISNVRPLSLDDAVALRRVRQVEATVPVIQGNAQIEAHTESGDRLRRSTVYGVGPDMPRVWQMKLATGRFLPPDDPNTARAFAVLGAKLRDELFGAANPLGAYIRVGGSRFRVIGVMEPKGQMLGFDLDDAVYLPAGRAMELFNRESLMEVDILYRPGADGKTVAKHLRRALIARHGSEDFTVITQQEMMDVLGSILDILTLAVGALGGISLLVGAVGILTIMIIAVNERTSEIGLLRALGASRRQVMLLFLGEAATLAGVGGLAGLALGIGGAWLLHVVVPALPTHTYWSYALLAEALSIVIGLTAGILPARRAARLKPVEALRTE
ncbi:MAG: ABC transporter permease [Gammaproteobacteria bacterium]